MYGEQKPTNPETAGLVRRSKYLEDAIQGLRSTPQSQFNTATGTNANILSNAILAFAGKGASDKADAAMKADQQRLTDAIMGTPQKTATAELGADAPFDLTPGGIDQRGQATDDARLQAIAEIGGPAALLQYQQNKEQTDYARGRDAMEDKRWDAQFGFQKDRAATGDKQWDRQFEFGVDRAGTQDNQWNQQFDFTQDRAGVADKQWGAEFGENQRQFNERMAAERAAAAQAAQLKQAEMEAKAAGGAVFEGPQLATIYNKGMDAIDEARKDQGRLDKIARTAEQFVSTAKDKGFWQQGEGFWNDMFQAFSMDTTTLKSLTDYIAPLMREAGSGSSSDRDIDMFKSAVVSVNNTPEANERFAKGASAIAKRNNEYVSFLTQAINPQDPQSRQKADQIWNIYKEDQSLFGDGGVVNEAVKPFDAWLSENMGGVTGAAPTGVQRPPVWGNVMGGAQAPADDDIGSLLEKYR